MARTTARTTPGAARTSRVAELVDLVHAAPKPAVLVIKHVGHQRQRCCLFGDMFCTILERLGCVGLVTDVNGRDRTAIRQRTPDFHLFSAGWVVSHGYPVYLEFNTTVSVCGLTIAPGDLLHGDESGLVAIPDEIADQVPEQTAKVLETEQEYFEFLESDRFSMDELRQRIVPHE